MAFTYTLIVQENKPVKKAPGSIWLKKSIGVCQIIYDNTQNILLPASGQGNLAIADGIYFKTVAEGSSPPSSPNPGDIWLQNDQNTYWIYLGNWVPFAGG
jgi:hypothetical protein